MKKFSILALGAVVSLGVTLTSCDSNKSVGSVKLNSAVDSISYLIGANYGQGLKQQLGQFPDPGNVDALINGFMKAAKGDSVHLGMDAAQITMHLENYFMGMQTRVAEETRAEGEAFLAANRAKSGVITTASGLQYQVITEGTGARPESTDNVRIHYTGKFLDGTVFDSSVERGEPLQGSASGFVPGFSEGLLLMPVGSKYTFWIPSELGYGPEGNQIIRPNSTLEFEVELLEIVR